MTTCLPFQPNQIVCIEQGDALLFAEVIQVSELRPMSWLRPLLLCKAPSDWNADPVEQAAELAEQICDLREGADLLWPLALLRAALDTEVIPLLTKLSAYKPQPGDRLAHRQLQEFTRRAWQASPEAFRL